MVWDVRFAASDLLAHVVSHTQTHSPPDHSLTHTHTHASAHRGIHAHTLASIQHLTPISSSTTPDYSPKPSPTVLPAARRLNLPGALHEHVARLCCASQSDRVTPRPSSSVLLVTLRVTACCCTLLSCLRAPVSPKNPPRRPSPSCLSCLYHLLAHRITAAHHHYYFYYCSSNPPLPQPLWRSFLQLCAAMPLQ